jgi:hypothetical protein
MMRGRSVGSVPGQTQQFLASQEEKLQQSRALLLDLEERLRVSPLSKPQKLGACTYKCGFVQETHFWYATVEHINAPASVLMDILWDKPAVVLRSDPAVKEFYDLEALSDAVKLQYKRHKFASALQDRDFVLLTHRSKLGSTHVLSSYSIERKEMPPVPNCVRGEAKTYGAVVREVTPTSCSLVVLAETDAKLSRLTRASAMASGSGLRIVKGLVQSVCSIKDFAEGLVSVQQNAIEVERWKSDPGPDVWSSAENVPSENVAVHNRIWGRADGNVTVARTTSAPAASQAKKAKTASPRTTDMSSVYEMTPCESFESFASTRESSRSSLTSSKKTSPRNNFKRPSSSKGQNTRSGQHPSDAILFCDMTVHSRSAQMISAV